MKTIFSVLSDKLPPLRLSLLLLSFIVFLCLSPAGPVMGGDKPLFRISVENTEHHVQTMTVHRFAEKLSQRLGNVLQVYFYSNARLFRDKDVIRALSEGKVEMAVPGNWHVMKFEPDVGIFLLPAFYGQPAELNYRLLDGELGRSLTDRIEAELPVKVLGSWIDLGHAHLFSMKKKIESVSDISGLRVRVAGGSGNTLRIAALGGQPMVIPWPDLPLFLAQGKIDGVLTSYETVQSAELWKKGVRYCFEDSEYFPQYIPMIRSSFWKKLSSEQKKIVVSCWQEGVEEARQAAEEAQQKGKQLFVENGGEIIVPPKEDLKRTRDQLLLKQKDIARQMGVGIDLLDFLNNI